TVGSCSLAPAFFFSSRRRHTRFSRDWSSDVCSSDLDGTAAIPLKVAEKDGTYTFYVATEGKPYLLKVVYRDDVFHTTTSFSAFDEPLDVRPPDKADVLDMSGVG